MHCPHFWHVSQLFARYLRSISHSNSTTRNPPPLPGALPWSSSRGRPALHPGPSDRGDTPLHKAASGDHLEVARALVAHGASPDVKDLNGRGLGASAVPRRDAVEPRRTGRLRGFTPAALAPRKTAVAEFLEARTAAASPAGGERGVWSARRKKKDNHGILHGRPRRRLNILFTSQEKKPSIAVCGCAMQKSIF